ncbi:MAG: prolyl oligopeptidase family serine peptidase [Planctomycetes bacterium]|nr:prolyl oligopeptidase family serine peptidase [Planctomycetota bacterium]
MTSLFHSLPPILLLAAALPIGWMNTPVADIDSPAAVVAAENSTSARGTSLYRIRSNGMNRWYRVHYPPNFDQQTATEVIVAYHGGGGNASEFMSTSGLNLASDLHGFVVVYPEGTGALGGWPFFTLETWNAGECCGWAADNNIDDVKFTRDMLQDLSKRMNIDSDALFATGHSNGAMMCYRLAIEAPSLFAAIAPNAGSRDVFTKPTQPIPLIAFHGALDCNVPFEGGFGCGISGTYKLSQEDTLKPFIIKNKAIVPALDQPSETRGKAHRFEANAPTTGADIHYWWMTDHGHAWPGHGSSLGDACNYDIDINEEMWVFFDQHRR